MIPTIQLLGVILASRYYNVHGDETKARNAFARANALAPADARIVYEQDQLLKRIGETPDCRLATFQHLPKLVASRDDLSVELASLYNQVGRPEDALQVLLTRRFQPWEGGEGLVLSQYVRANLLLGQRALVEKDESTAIRRFEAAWNPPQSISEAKHLSDEPEHDRLLAGCRVCSKSGKARGHASLGAGGKPPWRLSADAGSFHLRLQLIGVRRHSLSLGRNEEARQMFQEIYDYSWSLERQEPKIDYFATSLPAMLLFEEDLLRRQEIEAKFLRAQALLGLGQKEHAYSLLNEVLTMDANHSGAADLLATLETAVN